MDQFSLHYSPSATYEKAASFCKTQKGSLAIINSIQKSLRVEEFLRSYQEIQSLAASTSISYLGAELVEFDCSSGVGNDLCYLQWVNAAGSAVSRVPRVPNYRKKEFSNWVSAQSLPLVNVDGIVILKNGSWIYSNSYAGNQSHILCEYKAVDSGGFPQWALILILALCCVLLGLIAAACIFSFCFKPLPVSDSKDYEEMRALFFVANTPENSLGSSPVYYDRQIRPYFLFDSYDGKVSPWADDLFYHVLYRNADGTPLNPSKSISYVIGSKADRDSVESHYVMFPQLWLYVRGQVTHELLTLCAESMSHYFRRKFKLPFSITRLHLREVLEKGWRTCCGLMKFSLRDYLPKNAHHFNLELVDGSPDGMWEVEPAVPYLVQYAVFAEEVEKTRLKKVVVMMFADLVKWWMYLVSCQSNVKHPRVEGKVSRLSYGLSSEAHQLETSTPYVQFILGETTRITDWDGRFLAIIRAVSDSTQLREVLSLIVLTGRLYLICYWLTPQDLEERALAAWHFRRKTVMNSMRICLFLISTAFLKLSDPESFLLPSSDNVLRQFVDRFCTHIGR